MASSAQFESGLATVAAVLCILFGIIFPFGSTCTGEYNAVDAHCKDFLTLDISFI